MSAISHLALALCYLSVGVTVMSLFLPQKRTRKIFGFVLGLFVICSLTTCIGNTAVKWKDVIAIDEIKLPTVGAEDYDELIKQTTADNLVAAADEILRAEGIEARDIQISLKISDEGRIYVNNVVIYISENDLLRKQEIRNIIYRNLSKEPSVYVEKREVRSSSQE